MTNATVASADTEHWKILIVDDDAAGREAMLEWLERKGMHAIAVADGQAALDHIDDGVAVIVTDLKMPHTDGMQLLKLAKERAPHAAVILISGHGTIDTAVQALKEGAFDFLTKPIKLTELSHRIDRALESRRMATEIARLHAQLKNRDGLNNLVGNSAPMRKLFEKIQLVADARSTVLIIGEPGTGKELVAHAIHEASARRDEPFIPINCAAVPESLMEGQLFGHEKGVFTGAEQNRQGLFQAAGRGTLFLDEIGELPLASQSKLLRAVETKRIMPLGSSQEIEVNARLIAATNRDLEDQIRKKEFREDLYHRLKVIQLELPPLRDRPEDIPLLVRYFIDQIARDNERPVREISPEAVEALRQYDWPGNVRELRNTLESIMVLSIRDTIELSDLPEEFRGVTDSGEIIRPGMSMEQIEKEAIRRALVQTGGHRGKAANLLGVSVRNLQRKIKKFDLMDV